MRILVTGAGGFVGRHLMRHLADSGDEVFGTLAPGEAEPKGATRAVDLRDITGIRDVIGDFAPDAVVHLGGLSDVGASWRNLDQYFQVNVLGTENVLDAVPEDCRFVLASSAEVYGALEESELPARESYPLRPRTPYALTKASAERLALGRGAVVVRSFNLVGPGQSPRFALPAFARQLAAIRDGERGPVLRVGNLSARRDFVHVADGVAAYALVARAGVAGGVYNLASGRAVSIREALDLLIHASGLEVEIENDPERMRLADNPWSAGDPARLEQLGWRREHNLAQAVDDLWRSL